MLGEEGWRPTAAEAVEVGLIESVHSSERVLAEAQALAEDWVASGKPRQIKGESWEALAPELKAVNAAESHALATAFLSADFIEKQRSFLEGKGKTKQAKTFYWLGMTRPLWSLML
jgi:enoyl-CoA hydratase/carnithine racemase